MDLFLSARSARRTLPGCWRRHLWARGFFVVSSGNVTDAVIMEYIRTREMHKDDDDFRVEEA